MIENSTILDREGLLALTDTDIARVELPGTGNAVYVRGLTAREHARFTNLVQGQTITRRSRKSRNAEQITDGDTGAAILYVVSVATLDAARQPMFRESDMDTLAALPQRIIEPIAEKALELTGLLDPEDEDEIVDPTPALPFS